MDSKLRDYLKIEVYHESKFLKKLYFKYLAPPTNAVYLIRKYQFCKSKILSILYRKKLVTKYGIFISKSTKIGKGLKLPHPNGIIFGEHTIIGENCTIYQQVTFGSSRQGEAKLGFQPVVHDNCIFYAGCKIIGGIKIYSNTRVGANAVLLGDTEKSGGSYVGIPARKVKKNTR
ncbi:MULTISPECIES: serine acetyltransferase [Heyndrickxia]|uniref:serine acetyltransferase n=1 Tax=Heyndrickxia TaxID=2837504 RepID=UPI002DBBC69C|nr:serine acetyltransferase [Weizmannia sp. CD-2023]MEC2306271.1 serine acetyltransferase [Weizmannia sp. CD-2023]MEC2340580.1 serine acetyltransferase [Weizmannia sp. CD-2023]